MILRIVAALGLAFLIGCSPTPQGRFFYGSLDVGARRLILATQNTGAYTVLEYNLDGQLKKVLADSTFGNAIPKGIAPYDPFNIAVLYDGGDRIDRVSLIGESVATLVNDSNLTGTLYQLAYSAFGQSYFAIEGNAIETFTKSGARVGNPYIATTTGACVLSTPRGIVATADGRLIVINSGNGRLLVYDVSTSTPSCLQTNSALAGLTPIAVLLHSNGTIYVATQGDDRIYQFAGDGTGAGTVIWNTNLAVISNPTALLEMPDTTILVASDLTNSIERIMPDGTQVGLNSFIEDAFTGLITQMLLIGGE